MQVDQPVDKKQFYKTTKEYLAALARLKSAREELRIATAELDKVLEQLNSVYRERLEVLRVAATRQSRSESLDSETSNLLSYAEWLQEEHERLNCLYYPANDAVYTAEQNARALKLEAKCFGKAQYRTLRLFQESFAG